MSPLTSAVYTPLGSAADPGVWTTTQSYDQQQQQQQQSNNWQQRKQGDKGGGGSPDAAAAPYPDLRKTRMCPNMNSKEGCAYTAEECRYAHSANELRFSFDRFYKVLPCAFYEKGKCRNGEFCRFAHGSKELRSRPAVSYGGSGPGGKQRDAKSWTPAAEDETKHAGKRQQWKGVHQHAGTTTGSASSNHSSVAPSGGSGSPGEELLSISSHGTMEKLTPLTTPGGGSSTFLTADQLSLGGGGAGSVSTTTWAGADCSPTSESIMSSQSSCYNNNRSAAGIVFFPSPEQGAAESPSSSAGEGTGEGASTPPPAKSTYYEMCLSMGRTEILDGFYMSLNSVYTD